MFYNLKVKEVKRETPDTVSVAFEVPENLKEIFSYKHGQYLTFKKTLGGDEIRRSYSLCSSPLNGEDLRVAIKKVENGKFSSWANDSLRIGDVLETMSPIGNFTSELNAENQKSYVLFAAGSGITPVMSIIKSVLIAEPKSRVILYYGNRDSEHTIFKTELDELCAKHSARLNVHYVFSRTQGESSMLSGRINREKCSEFNKAHDILNADEFFLCGPEAMIMDVKEYLEGNGISKSQVHFELFTTPVKAEKTNTSVSSEVIESHVTVIMDDEEFEFDLSSDGDCILDASIDAGIDAPFSCKGAVCCTCKAKVVEGSARMEMNYALDDFEVEEGYILTCQAHPTSEKVVVDYDVV